MEDKLTLELLKEVKANGKKWFVIYLLEHCNFVNEEKDLFLLRASGNTIEEASEIMDIPYDTIRKISRKVNKKIIKVL